MAQTVALERRVSEVTDRRHVVGRGGRRTHDHRVSELDLRIACGACGGAWASLRSFAYQRGQPMASYRCRRCGHLEKRAAAA
jgi:hypothetical protein